MNIDKLFSCQGRLDNRIVVKKGLQGVDLLDKKILALLTELGELANEWQMFKFWKDNPIPNTHEETECHACKGDAVFYVMGEREVCANCAGEGVEKVTNPLLEEYVDCLHFILSIGNDKGWTAKELELNIKADDISFQFLGLFYQVSHFAEHQLKSNYYIVLRVFLILGEMLGFTTDQIEQAYFDKNKINHARQESGY